MFRNYFLAFVLLVYSNPFSLAMEKEPPPSKYAQAVWKPGTTEEEKKGLCSGLFLEEPLIIVTPEDYAKDHNVKKLVLGGGHVKDHQTVLPIDYQPEEGNGLRPSYQNTYEYHQNNGWYAVSAEVSETFGSDFICDIQNPLHQQALIRPNFWDLIWDDSAHVNVFEAPGLLENIATWLTPGGKYIVGIPSLIRPPRANPTLAEAIIDLWDHKGHYWTTILETCIINNLTKLGFSKVEVKISPFNLFLHSRFHLSPGEDTWAKVIAKPEDVMNSLYPEFSRNCGLYTQEIAQIDPVFNEASIGFVYIVATK